MCAEVLLLRSVATRQQFLPFRHVQNGISLNGKRALLFFGFKSLASVDASMHNFKKCIYNINSVISCVHFTHERNFPL